MSGRSLNLLPEDEFDKRFKGIALPVDKKPGGFFQKQYTRQIIRASILDILKTRKGERVMLPDYGSSLANIVFDPNDQATSIRIRSLVSKDLARWEPRIRVLSVDASFPTGATNRIFIRVNYEISAVSIADSVNLVLSGGALSR